MPTEKIVIIGGVAGGATAAAKARRLSSTASITMLEAGPDVSFANCGLPYYIGGDIQSRSKLILQSPESFKDQYNVTVHTNTQAVQIDRTAQIVQAVNANGQMQEFPYTKLILAQGGKPIIPPLPGANLPHVFSLWTLEDMDAIHMHISDHSPQSAVVVGGGFIGLEMAEALAKRGLQVHIVEMQDHIMSVLEAEISGFLHEELTAYGVQIHTGVAVSKIDTDSVTLNNGAQIASNMVLLSVGVKPTLSLAQESGLQIGQAGGLVVNEFLQTSDPNIYAAGDMVEITHTVSGQKVRIPLAGPANRQGRIAASNALGIPTPYKGSIGTSVVRVFDAVAGSTGLSLKQAKQLGLPAQSVTVHKEHHTSYYPGSQPVTVLLVFNSTTGVVLGGQTAGFAGADKRLDAIATAVNAGLTLDDLAQTDFAYSPPIGTANDALNMAAYVAQNKMSGYSPSIAVSELSDFVATHAPIILDVRDVFAFNRAHIQNAVHVPYTHASAYIPKLPTDKAILLYDETGKYAHLVLREFLQQGLKNVHIISGGFSSLVRYARVMHLTHLELPLPPLDSKSLQEHSTPDAPAAALQEQATQAAQAAEPIHPNQKLIVDVRTPQEFAMGAVPQAINIPLDILQNELEALQPYDREIILYCASGARSAYGVRVLQHFGFTNVTNGGGIMDMMQ